MEKTLAKYPHSFDIVYQCAELYHLVGMENGNKRLLKKAIELYSRCFPLLSQNQDDTVSELSHPDFHRGNLPLTGRYKKRLCSS